MAMISDPMAIDRHQATVPARFSFVAMGSPCELYFTARSHAQARTLQASVVDWVKAYEGLCSFYRPDSQVSRINDAAGAERVGIDPLIDELLTLCDWYYWATNGYFDPTSAPLLRLWDYHDPELPLPSAEAVSSARALMGWSHVEHSRGWCRLPQPGMAIDLGGIGKEFAVDKIMDLILQAGVRDVLLNFGHDVRVMGRPPQGGAWSVGLEDPRQTGRCWCGLKLDQGAVCTSGDYMRFRMIEGRRYGHIIDTQTGYPVANDCLSATVVGPTCTEAGVLSTVAFMMGGEQGIGLLRRTFGVEGALVTPSGVVATPGFERYVVSGCGREEKSS